MADNFTKPLDLKPPYKNKPKVPILGKALVNGEFVLSGKNYCLFNKPGEKAVYEKAELAYGRHYQLALAFFN